MRKLRHQMDQLINIPLDCVKEILSHCSYLQTQLIRSTCKHYYLNYKKNMALLAKLQYLGMERKFISLPTIYHYVVAEQPLEVVKLMAASYTINKDYFYLDLISYWHRQSREGAALAKILVVLDSGARTCRDRSAYDHLEVDFARWTILHDAIPKTPITDKVKIIGNAAMSKDMTTFPRGTIGYATFFCHHPWLFLEHATANNNYEFTRWLIIEGASRKDTAVLIINHQFQWNDGTLQTKYLELFELLGCPYERSNIGRLSNLRLYQFAMLVDVLRKGASIKIAQIYYIVNHLPEEIASSILELKSCRKTIFEAMMWCITRANGGNHATSKKIIALLRKEIAPSFVEDFYYERLMLIMPPVGSVSELIKFLNSISDRPWFCLLKGRLQKGYLTEQWASIIKYYDLWQDASPQRYHDA